MLDMLGLKIDAEEFRSRICRRQKAQAEPLAATELEVAKRPAGARGRLEAADPGAEVQPVGRHLAIEAVAVSHRHVVAMRPVTHSRSSPKRLPVPLRAVARADKRTVANALARGNETRTSLAE